MTEWPLPVSARGADHDDDAAERDKRVVELERLYEIRQLTVAEKRELERLYDEGGY